MRTSTNSINLSLNFNQVIELVKQLPYQEKVRLGNVIRKEMEANVRNDKVLTHFASEPALAKDWISTEEDEAWKNL